MNYNDYEFFISDTPECKNESLYDFQKEAIKELNKYFRLEENIPDRNGLLVMPTGSGKTHTAVYWLLKDCITKGYQVVWLVHRVELVNQAFNEIRDHISILKRSDMPNRKNFLRIIPISSNKEYNHIPAHKAFDADIYVACINSMQSSIDHIKNMISKERREKLIIVIDEAHHGVSGSYQEVIKRIRSYLCHNCILLGLTATPYRMSKDDQNALNGMYNIYRGGLYNGFVYEVKISKLIKNGTLSTPIYIPVPSNYNGIEVFSKDNKALEYFRQFRELSPSMLNKMSRHKVRNATIVEEFLNNKEKFGKTLIFALNQSHAKNLCKKLRENGIKCDYAISQRKDSQYVIQRFKENDDIDVLINVNMLIEGSDVPDIQTVFITRPTNSKSVMAQMIGRALRGKNAKSKNATGTETAYIVAFHDIWDSYISFLDPNDIINSSNESEDENRTDNPDQEFADEWISEMK